MDRDLSEMAHKVFPTEPDGSALYPAAGQQRIVAALQHDIVENKHIVCVTGPLGSGKTTVLRTLRKCYTKGVVGLLEQPKPGKVLVELTKSLQLDSSEANESFLRRQLAMLLSMADKLSHPIIQIVDGADQLPTDDLNLLLHFFPPGHATLVLAGVNPPETWLADCVTSVGAARIHQSYALEAFTAEETTGYINHRLRAGDLPEDLFTAEQLATIYQQSDGWPGAINRLCAELLMQGDDQPQVTAATAPKPEPMPEPETQPELEPLVEPVTELPRQATEKAIPAYVAVEPAAETQPAIPPPAAPSREVSTVTQVERVVVEPMPWRAQRLRRSVRLWRAATIVVSGLLAVVLLQDAWIEHSIFERPVLGGLATTGNDPTAADASSSTPSEITAGEITATGEPVNTAESPDQSADFAALHPASSQTQQPPLTSASETGPSTSQSAVSGTAIAPTEAPRVFSPEPTHEAPAQASLTEPPEPPKPAAVPAPAVKPEPPPMSRAQREEVARLYAERAEYEWRKGEMSAAAASIRNGLATDPRNPELLELRDLLREVDPYR